MSNQIEQLVDETRKLLVEMNAKLFHIQEAYEEKLRKAKEDAFQDKHTLENIFLKHYQRTHADILTDEFGRGFVFMIEDDGRRTKRFLDDYIKTLEEE